MYDKKTKIINTSFLLKRALSYTWEDKNPILHYGEPGFEKDTNKIKIGDGRTPWNDLGYIGDNVRIVVTDPQQGQILTYNSVTKKWENVDLNANKIYSNTTAYWNSMPSYIPQKNDIIIYTDYYSQEEDGEINYYPGIKIADGMAFLIDQPFIDKNIRDIINQHINNNNIHVTSEEKEFWNNKVRCYIDSVEEETLTFTTF